MPGAPFSGPLICVLPSSGVCLFGERREVGSGKWKVAMAGELSAIDVMPHA